MISAETWKMIEGYPNYFVSDLGRVKSLARGNGKILSEYGAGSGYRMVSLGRNAKMYVHRLVALAFLPVDPCKVDVNHKNGVKHDNQLKNLEWVTRSQNNIHAVQIGLIKTGDRHVLTKYTDEQIAGMRALWSTRNFTQNAIGRMFGCSGQYVNRIILGGARASMGGADQSQGGDAFDACCK